MITKRKAIVHMKKKCKVSLLRRSLTCLLVAAMFVGFLPVPQGQASSYDAS